MKKKERRKDERNIGRISEKYIRKTQEEEEEGETE